MSTQILVFLKMAGVDIGPLHLVFGLPPDVDAATLGDIGIEDVVKVATGVSATFNASVPLFHVVTLCFLFRFRTTWPSVSTGVSRSAA